MKNRAFFMLTVCIFLFSCERGLIVPEHELPDWLLQKIEEDEEVISVNPKNYLASGSWVRFEWDEMFYYEYWNMLSSTHPKPISHEGDTLGFFATDASTDYSREKCCQEYVWKGPKYMDWSFKD